MSEIKAALDRVKEEWVRERARKECNIKVFLCMVYNKLLSLLILEVIHSYLCEFVLK